MEDSFSKMVDLLLLIFLVTVVPVMLGKRYGDRLALKAAENLSESFLDEIRVFEELDEEDIEAYRDGLRRCSGLTFHLERESCFYLPGEIRVASCELLSDIEKIIGERGSFRFEHGDIVRLTVADRLGSRVLLYEETVNGVT